MAPDRSHTGGACAHTLLLSLLCADPPEQCCEKSRKMPSCSPSESEHSSSISWSIVISGLDGRLGPELVSWAITLEDEVELNSSEPVQSVSSPGEGSGRTLGECCWCWRGWGSKLPSSAGWSSWMEVTSSAERKANVRTWTWLTRPEGFENMYLFFYIKQRRCGRDIVDRVRWRQMTNVMTTKRWGRSVLPVFIWFWAQLLFQEDLLTLDVSSYLKLQQRPWKPGSGWWGSMCW